MENLPFEEEVLETFCIREFRQETDSGDYKWHRDREDRVIESIEKTDWLIQMDDELPKPIEGNVFIKKGVYHRIIKGTGNLVIKLTKRF